MPYWDKRSKKRPEVETGRSLEKDVFMDLQRPLGDKILIPRLVFDAIRELDHRVPKVGTAEGHDSVLEESEGVSALRNHFFSRFVQGDSNTAPVSRTR